MHFAVLVVLPILALLLTYPCVAVAAHVVHYRSRLITKRKRSDRGRISPYHACVLSLSPATQSPRALNHALAFALSGKFTVCIHACAPAPQLPHGRISFIPIKSIAERHQRTSFLRKIVSQSINLYHSLVTEDLLQKYDIIVLNTPPCIPVFVVALFAARIIHSCPVIVDWHNFAYTIMQTTGASRVLVIVARLYELFIGRAMDAHICVSQAMSRHLAEHWGIDAKVVYDRPLSAFRRIDDLNVRHELLKELQVCAQTENPKHVDETIATFRDENGVVCEKSLRPAIITSSTSWTPDENFDILLDALVLLDKKLTARRSTQKRYNAQNVFDWEAICVITGKGPLRSAFEEKVGKARLNNINIWFAWLPAKCYPQLLGCADLGISLHTSSSELDLPMKVADMLGCGLPVLSFRYHCMEEVILPGKTGLLFESAGELSNYLYGLLFEDEERERLRSMATYIQRKFALSSMRWENTWGQEVLPMVENLCK